MKFTAAARRQLMTRFTDGLEMGLYLRLEDGRPVEPVASGYHAQRVSGWKWDEAAGALASPVVTWVFMAGLREPVAGWFLRWAGGEVATVEAFAAPVAIDNLGDRIEVEAVFDAPGLDLIEE